MLRERLDAVDLSGLGHDAKSILQAAMERGARIALEAALEKLAPLEDSWTNGRIRALLTELDPQHHQGKGC